MIGDHTTDEVSTMHHLSGEWEARIEYSHDPERMLKEVHESTVFYDHSVEGLRKKVGDFLSVNAPGYFSNIGDHLAGRWRCFYADGVKEYPFLPPNETLEGMVDFTRKFEPLPRRPRRIWPHTHTT